MLRPGPRIGRREARGWALTACATGAAWTSSAISCRPSDLHRRCSRWCTGRLLESTGQESFDLVTCVHGLHYVGDKLAVLERARGLTDDGMFVASFDPNGVRYADGSPARQALTAALRKAGFGNDARPQDRLRPPQVRLPFAYLGADDTAGPNYTGQPAVWSHYAPL